MLKKYSSGPVKVPFIHSKLPDLSTTIFTVVNQLANTNGAVNLAQGFPDFEAPQPLIAMVHEAMGQNYNQYAPMAGVLDLRETLVQKIEKLYGKSYHPETEITITAGATQAIFTTISAFVNKGDEVIILTPAYDCYQPAIALQGGVCVPVELTGIDFRLDINKIREAITDKTKMLIVNTPHNPSGKTLSKNDMLALQDLLRNTNIIVLSDEVYEHMIFDGLSHQSAARFSGLAERSIICTSFGKTFHVTGWKIGYCVGPETLMQEFRKVHQYNVFSVGHPVQIGLNNYLKNERNYLSLGHFYSEKRDYFLNAITSSRFTFTPSMGTFFQLLDYSAISEATDMNFVEYLIKEHKIASIPISVFGTSQQQRYQIRFCFAKKKETLDKAAEILNQI